ncbi:hypothetical protein [Flavicella sediminum]|uniref:hypothetical protein n=1 Tax=Flavicella sediminum TaxID=2585141 RepID=UPI00111CE183|nr:hypothetical protein [Flavicella sediminum]
MKKSLLILIAFNVFTTLSFGQNERKYWSVGQLTWEDFKEERLEIRGSIPALYLTYEQEKTKIKNTTINRIKAIAFINTENSFVDLKAKNDQILYYHQIEFDILEYYRRKLQTELYNASYAFNIEAKLNGIKEQLLDELDRFRVASHYSSNKEALDTWKTTISKKLEHTDPDPIPETIDRNFSYGGYFGIEHAFASNSLNKSIKPGIGLTFGLDFGWKKSLFSLNTNLIFIKLKEDLFLKEQLFKDKKYGMALASFTYGYPIMENRKFKLTPFIGYGITEISERTEEENSFRTISSDIHYGLNFDYKFKNTLNLVPNFMNRKTRMDLFLRTRVYIAKSNFNAEFQGNTINIGFLFGGNERKINLRK